MTRDDVIEAMAAAFWNAGQHRAKEDGDELADWAELESVGDEGCNLKSAIRLDMAAALSALESLGIALVPVEPSGQMVIAAPWAGPSVSIDVYRAMLSASPLRKTEGA